jgi:hypothetical protein
MLSAVSRKRGCSRNLLRIIQMPHGCYLRLLQGYVASARFRTSLLAEGTLKTRCTNYSMQRSTSTPSKGGFKERRSTPHLTAPSDGAAGCGSSITTAGVWSSIQSGATRGLLGIGESKVAPAR